MRARPVRPADLIRRCESSGWTRAQVARAVGVYPSTITRLATGERGQRISAATLHGLLRAVDRATGAAGDHAVTSHGDEAGDA